MNRRMPEQRLRLARAELTEIDPAELITKPRFSIRFGGMLDGRQLMRVRGSVDDFNGFEAVCTGYVGQGVAATAGEPCVLPPVALRAVSRSGEQVQFAVTGVNRSANARFNAQYGVVGYAITSFRIILDEEAAPTNR